jgi:ATP-dependent protease ClpP protease subunit
MSNPHCQQLFKTKVCASLSVLGVGMRILARSTIALALATLASGLALSGSGLADEGASSAWFSDLGHGSRAQIQMDLIVTGFYGDSVDAEFGPATYAALTKYQASIGQRDDGVLTYSQRKQLRTQASGTLQEWGMQKVSDDALGAEFVVPEKLLPFETKDDVGRRYASSDGSISLLVQRVPASRPYEVLYMEQIAQVNSKLPNYLRFRPDFWVVSGQSNGTLFYSMMRRAADGSSVGFTINAGLGHTDEGGRLAVYEAARFIVGDPAKLETQTAAVEPPPAIPSTQAPAPELGLTEVSPEAGPPSSSEHIERPITEPSGVNPAQVGGPVRTGPDGSQPTEYPEPVGPAQSSSSVKEATLADETIGPFTLLASDPTVIILDGQIDSQTPLEFIRALRDRPNATAIILNSPGGQVDGGLILANQVHDRHMVTYIPKEAGCYSACSFVLFAGAKRLVEGELGVHQISMEQHGDGDLVTGQMKLSDILDALNDYGVDPRIVSLMLRTKPEDMHVFKAQELQDFGINN